MLILRVCLGLVFFWFGFLKYFPAVSVAEEIASKTILAITGGLIKAGVSMPLLATWECLIGIGLITGRKLPLILFLLYLQMIGTLLLLIIFRNETWTSTPFVPTLLGQYIIKNFVLISAGIVIGATSHGGALISDPLIAGKALDVQTLYDRYQRRFKRRPRSDARVVSKNEPAVETTL